MPELIRFPNQYSHDHPGDKVALLVLAVLTENLTGTDMNPMRPDLLLFTLALPVFLLLPACTSIGAGTVHRDRLDYSEALTTSWKEQTLLNIVKLRYADTPVFLEVSSVISSRAS
jgi:hypothetical protein